MGDLPLARHLTLPPFPPMKKLFGILLLLVIVLGFVVPQFFIPKAYAMDRGMDVNAAPAAAHATITNLPTWQEWSAWNKERDPSLEYTYSGTPGTVGHRMDWTSTKDGNGALELTSVAPDRIEYTMEMEGWDPSFGAFVLTPSGTSAVNIRWEMNGEMTGMPVKRYFGLMMDNLVGPMFEQGLQGLKTRLEAPQTETPAGE